MKTLAIGILVFFGWSALSTYFYVCKIKGLCAERVNIIVGPVEVEKAFTADSMPNILAAKPAGIPDNLSIYFDFDKYDFTFSAKTDSNFSASSAYLLQNSEARLSITGHTDAVGSAVYNQALGMRRAQSVRKYFENKGMSGSKIEIDSKGENEAAENNNTITGRAKNRRAAITIKN
jgi:outer membrane protein OmpA-like peptidoglycan-associated protein